MMLEKRPGKSRMEKKERLWSYGIRMLCWSQKKRVYWRRYKKGGGLPDTHYMKKGHFGAKRRGGEYSLEWTESVVPRLNEEGTTLAECQFLWWYQEQELEGGEGIAAVRERCDSHCWGGRKAATLGTGGFNTLSEGVMTGIPKKNWHEWQQGQEGNDQKGGEDLLKGGGLYHLGQGLFRCLGKKEQKKVPLKWKKGWYLSIFRKGYSATKTGGGV